jgi:hypothetical protein
LAETIPPFYQSHMAWIEPDDRLVVLARTIHARDPGTETALKDSAVNWARFGDTCLGQALYRHRTVFKNASEAPVWSHLELSYFRSMVPGDAILDLVVKRQPAAMDLLRAEILLTTPSSFVLPRDWQGLADRSERQGITGVYPGETSIFRRVPGRHAGLLWPCCREACPGGEVRNVQGNGDGGGALS